MVELVVQKYGGTSLQTTGRMAEAADRIIKETKRGSQVIVVVSAMGRTTDDLTTLAGPGFLLSASKRNGPAPFYGRAGVLCTDGDGPEGRGSGG